MDTPISPGPRSPPVSRQQSLPPLDTAMRQVKEPYQEYTSSQSAQEENGQRRQQQQPQKPQEQRNNVVANLERKAKEHELKERELELERRALELEKEKARLQTLREEDRGIEREQNVYRESNNAHSQANQFGLRPRERRTSLRHQLQRPLSQMDLDDDNRNIPSGSSSANPKRLSQGQYPNSNNGYLNQTSTTQPLYNQRQPQTPDAQHETQGYPNDSGSGSNLNTNSSSNSSHAPYCGCESCSVSKYREAGKVSNKASQAKQSDQRSDKVGKPSGSWIRRLSMPVGNAFSSNDSKRHQSNNSVGGNAVQYSLGSGVGNIPSSPGRGLFSMDYKRNASTTALLSSSTGSGERTLHAQEDGRLRNNGVSNRSMTNLGILGRH